MSLGSESATYRMHNVMYSLIHHNGIASTHPNDTFSLKNWSWRLRDKIEDSTYSASFSGTFHIHAFYSNNCVVPSVLCSWKNLSICQLHETSTLIEWHYQGKPLGSRMCLQRWWIANTYCVSLFIVKCTSVSSIVSFVKIVCLLWPIVTPDLLSPSPRMFHEFLTSC